MRRNGSLEEVLGLNIFRELCEDLASRPRMPTRFISATMRQRLSRRTAEGVELGVAEEGLAASNKPYEG